MMHRTLLQLCGRLKNNVPWTLNPSCLRNHTQNQCCRFRSRSISIISLVSQHTASTVRKYVIGETRVSVSDTPFLGLQTCGSNHHPFHDIDLDLDRQDLSCYERCYSNNNSQYSYSVGSKCVQRVFAASADSYDINLPSYPNPGSGFKSTRSRSMSRSRFQNRHQDRNSKEDDDGQEWRLGHILGFSSIPLVLLCISFLWKNGNSDDYQIKKFPWLIVAACRSESKTKESEIPGDVKLNRSRSNKQDDSHSDPILTASPEEKSVTPGEIQRKVDETDALSFRQAVEITDDLLKKQKIEVGSPGIVVCVSVDGKYVYSNGFGHADVENQVSIHSHSVVRIASISKPITTAIVAKLCEEGKLNLDKSIYHYVPKFPEKYFLGEKVDITVRQLLTHTSGIRHYWLQNDPVLAFQSQVQNLMSAFDAGIVSLFYSNLKEKIPKDLNQSKDDKKEDDANSLVMPAEYYNTKLFANTTQALKMFSNDRLMAKPGNKYIYSSLAYTLLSAAIEAVTKKPFATVAKETFVLWGLKETYLDQHEPLIYNRARHYYRKKGVLLNTPFVDVSYKWAGGGFLSSVMDVVKFGNLMLYSHQHGDKDSGPPGYLKQSTIKDVWTSIEHERISQKYGLGFEIFPAEEHYGMCPNHTFAVGHTGIALGASSVLFVLPRSLSQMNDDKTGRMPVTRNPSDVNQQSNERQKMPSSSPDHPCLPQGVVVAVFVNMTNVNLRDLARKIARVFERVILD